MKTTTMIGIFSLIITLSLTSCYWSTTRSTAKTPGMTTTTRSITY
jgi:hypothetical protein